SSAMARACPGHRFLGVAELRDHRLAFTRRSLRTGTGVADVLLEPGASVWGALYELDDADLVALDEKEGSGWAYQRKAVRLSDEDGRSEHDAFAYVVIEPELDHVPPSREYLQALLDGARERGLPLAYIDALAATTKSAPSHEDSRL
ncbi:MAG TPA: gamma-glutamylcyclotransferase family protein, partial [Solirubrobacteraceae bacterium]|nr:gamma-glutamylcyclotransferase family protein [Solirubrobacteraceae bacterium]